MKNTLLALALLLTLFVSVTAWSMQPASVATESTDGTADRARPLPPAPARRLLGMCLLASTGAVVVLRARRRRI